MRYASFLSVSSLTLAVLCCAAALGCAPDKGPGEVVVNYVLGNNKTCAELGVERLEVMIYQGTPEEPTVEYEANPLCDDSGEIIIDAIEPGLYSVVAYAYDDAGVAILDNFGQSDAERRIEVFEAAESSIEAELTARPAQLQVAWRLGEGGFGNCGGVGIDAFEVGMYQVDGGNLLLEAVLDCELTGDSMGYRLIPDPNRELNGTLFGEVGIQALNTAGNPVGAPALFSFDPVGSGYSVKLNIECTDMGCYEQP